MIGGIVVDLNRLPSAKVEKPDTVRTRKADEACLETIGVSLEPTLDDLLSEPIIAALMRADGIDPAVLKATIREQAALTRRHALVADCAISSSDLASECKTRVRTRDTTPGSFPDRVACGRSVPPPDRPLSSDLPLKRDPCQVPQVKTETGSLNSCRRTLES
jgi:hypothetical protein